MDLCVGCKGCKRECANQVDMAAIKIEWQAQRNAAFRALDRLPFLAKAREIAPSANPLPLPPGALECSLWVEKLPTASVIHAPAQSA